MLILTLNETSSIENRRPPTGAPKAEETPAAAPAEIKFLRSSGFLVENFENLQYKFYITKTHFMTFSCKLSYFPFLNRLKYPMEIPIESDLN